MPDTPATPATIAAYLTAAQAAYVSGDYDEAETQVVLGEMELAKLPVSDGHEGESTAFRQSFKSLIERIDARRRRKALSARPLRFTAREA